MTKSKLVYIASPFAGDIEGNIAFARRACLYAIAAGNTPIAVHLLYPLLLNDVDPTQRETGLRCGLDVLERCDELWVCGDRISSGMQREIAHAIEQDITIHHIPREEIEQGAGPDMAERVDAVLTAHAL